MPGNNIIFKEKKATEGEILDHLRACNAQFVPALDSRVNIEEYAKKLFEKAITFEAWNGTILAGLVATYFTDTSNGIAFVSDVSLLKEYQGQGIATILLNQCVDHARKNQFSEIRLEAGKNNTQAIALYTKLDFEEYGMQEDQLQLVLKLNQ